MFPGQSAQFLSPKTCQYHLCSVGRRNEGQKGGGIDCLHQADRLVQEAVRLVTGGPPGTRLPAWILRAAAIFSSKVDFQFIHSYFTLDKNPRACSGFQDLNFIFAIGFEHQEGDSDLH